MLRFTRLVLGVLCLTVASTALAQNGTTFYPSKKDTKWVYKAGETEIEVKVTEVKEGEIKLDTIVNNKQVASESLQIKEDGIYRTKINTTPVEPPVKFFQFADGKPADKGATWDVDSKIQQQSVKGKFTVKDTEKVKVPGGEFDAIVIDGPDFEIAGTKTSVTYWFAEGKGIVKLKYGIGGNDAVLELKEFTEGK